MTQQLKQNEYANEVQECLQTITPSDIEFPYMESEEEEIEAQGTNLSSINPLAGIKAEVNHNIPILDKMGEFVSKNNPLDFSKCSDWFTILRNALSNPFFIVGIIVIVFSCMMSAKSNKNRLLIYACYIIIMTVLVYIKDIAGLLGWRGYVGIVNFVPPELSILWGDFWDMYNRSTKKSPRTSPNSDGNDETTFDKNDYVYDEMIDPDLVEAQSGISLDILSTSLVAILAGAIGYNPKSCAVNSVKEFMKMNSVVHGNMLAIVTQGLSTTSKLLDKLKCPDFVGKIFDLPVASEEINEWIQQVNSFTDDVATSITNGYADNTETYLLLNARFLELSKTVEKGSAAMNLLVDTKKALERCKTSYERRFKSLKGKRPTPVMIVFLGAPNVMKTTVANQFADMLNKLTLTASKLADYMVNPDEYTFRRSIDKWWDGYSSRANVTIMDDIFQGVDPGNDPSSSEAAYLIKMINEEEFAVPMASVDQKNNVFFRSGFVVGTANALEMRLINSIHCKDALRRRMHFVVNTTINEKYLNAENKIDWTKVPQIFNNDGEVVEDSTYFPMDFWCFNYEEVIDGQWKGTFTSVSYEDLLTKVVERYYKHQKYFEMNKFVNDSQRNSVLNTLRNKVTLMRNDLSFLRSHTQSDDIPTMPGAFEAQSGFPYNGNVAPLVRSINDAIGNMPKDHYDDFMKNLYMAVNNYDALGLDIEYPRERFIYSLPVDKAEKLIMLLNKFMTTRRGTSSYEDCSCIIFNLLHEICHARFIDKKYVLDGMPKPVVRTIDKIMQPMSEALGEAIAFVVRHKFKLAIGAVACSTIIYAFAKFIYSFENDNDSEPHSGNTERYMSKGPSRNVQRPIKPLKTHSVKIDPQGNSTLDVKWLVNKATFKFGTKSNFGDVLTSVVDKYHFIVYLVDENGDESKIFRLGHATNIEGKNFLVNYHYKLQLEDYVEDKNIDKVYLTFTTASNVRKFSVYARNYLASLIVSEYSMENDWCIAAVGNERNSVGAKKFFISKNDLNWKKRPLFPTCLVGSHQNGDDHQTVVFRVMDTNSTLQKDDVIVRASWKTEHKSSEYYRLTSTIGYDGNFYKGDCGSLMALKTNTTGHRVLAGMHVAGSSTRGYSIVITQEDIDELNTYNEEPSVQFLEEIEPQGLERTVSIQFELQAEQKKVNGVFDKEHSIAVCSVSEIRRSKLFGKIPGPEGEVKTKPSLLYPREINGVWRDPIKIAMAKYELTPVPIDPEPLQEACWSYFTLLENNSNILKSERKMVDLKQALHSFGQHVHGIDPATSAGWPMNTSSEEDIKSLYFAAVIQNDVINQDKYFDLISTKVDEVFDLYSKRIRPAFVFSDALKSEVRKITKVNEGATRMFSGCPFILLVVSRMLFGSFMDEFFHMNIRVGSAIGMNPYSTAWDDLTHNLLKFSPDSEDLGIGAGDYKSFDCTQRPEILEAICDLICGWYGESDGMNNIRRYVWSEITHSRHIFGKDYYEWTNGMPSGNPLTPVINTMYNHLAMRMSWWYAGLNVELFNKKAYVIALGDDNVFAVSPEFRDVFNEVTLSTYMSYIGLNYTTELKVAAKQPFRKITQVDFLKRSFRPILLRGVKRFIAPIQMDTIVNMIYWTKKGDLADQITKDNLRTAYRELSLHGKEVFEKYFFLLQQLDSELLSHVNANGKMYLGYKDALYDTLGLEHNL